MQYIYSCAMPAGTTATLSFVDDPPAVPPLPPGLGDLVLTGSIGQG